MARGFAIALILALGAVGGCDFSTNEFVCAVDTECPASTGYGRCIEGHCAFRSDSCPSGWVYDETGGDVADQCVPSTALRPDAAPEPADAGPSIDAPPLSVDGGATIDAGAVDGATPD